MQIPISATPVYPDYPHKLRIGSREAVFDRGWVQLSPIHDNFEVVEAIEEWAKLNVHGGFTAHAETLEGSNSQSRKGYVSGMNLDYIEFVFSFENLNDLIYFKLRWYQ